MGRNSRLIPNSAVLGLGTALILGAAAATTGCNEHPVALVSTTGAVEHIVPVVGVDSEKLDILWMIDNSGSMCRSQEVLRDGIRDFVEILGEINLDFHIAVTTTHLEETYFLEPVARPGHLQSTPQPLPGFDPNCHHALDEMAQPIISRLDPVLENIRVAIECTEDPSAWAHLLDPPPNDLELRCALNNFRRDVDCAAAFGANMPSLEAFFPQPDANGNSPYREIPLVLRSEDYSDASGALDLARLEADFSCMSLVGTRGYGFEKGLGAVELAVSPELTGGPNGDPAEYPNAGFIRPDARLGLIFVTDENDCTHDGTLNESSNCAVHQCTIQENLGAAGALIPVHDIRREFMRNLARTKGISVAEEPPEGGDDHDDVFAAVANEVIAASIHAPYQRDVLTYLTRDPETGEVIDEERVERAAEPADCTQNIEIRHSCRTTMGRGWSGHRYAEFISEFPTFFPDPRLDSQGRVIRDSFEIEDIEGEVCNEFEPTLREIARLFAIEGGSCIYDIYRCAGPSDETCPAHPHTGEAGQCLRYPGYTDASEDPQFYCNTGVELRLSLGADSDDLSRLENTGYCLEGTINPPDFPNSCVIDPGPTAGADGGPIYRWTGCGASPGLSLQWEDEQWQQIVSGLNVEARYARIPFGG